MWTKLTAREHILYPLPNEGAYIEERRFFGRCKRRILEFTLEGERANVVALVDGVYAGAMPLLPGTGVTLELGDEIRLPGGASFRVTSVGNQTVEDDI